MDLYNYKYVKDMGTQYGIGYCSSQEIDQLNIHQANLLCMERAYKNLKVQNCKVYIDGVFMPNIKDEAFAIKSGDKLIPIISLASVIAKVERDKYIYNFFNFTEKEREIIEDFSSEYKFF